MQKNLIFSLSTTMNHHPSSLPFFSYLLMSRKNHTHLLFLSLFLTLSLYSVSAIDVTSLNSVPLPSSDALSLLDFKSKADSANTLPFPSPKNPLEHCKWVGVKCAQGKVVRIVLEGFNLGGIFGPNTLNRLDQLRVLSLRNNSLTGTIPDLSGLINLKTLFLHFNSFTGSFPPSILSLHRMRTLDLSHNNLSSPIPIRLIDLDRIFYLRLEWNQFNGSIPPLNQSSLQIFNVSGNNLTGAVPITVSLSRFDSSSFLWNPGLCGEILHRDCKFQSPFFVPSSQPPKPSDGFGDKQFQGLLLPPPSPKMHKSSVLILGFSVGVFLLLGLLLSVWVAIKRRRNQKRQVPPSPLPPPPTALDSSSVTNSVIPLQEESELEAKVKKIQVVKSGNLIFCAGESQICTLEQLMRGSAEMLGRGTIGTTYKAVLDNHLIVSVKRLDVSKTANTSKEVFESHIESVGRLRHPNLVPLRAYFQAKDERLLMYDYQSNGSLFSLIHGSRSTRAKPLHWTSCLKIAEDVAQGLAFIHQTSRLVHGNIKSSNVLLGADFEACLTDYCLSILASSNVDDTDSSGYKAPEIRKSSRQATPKSDVYSFGILLVELLTSKPPSQHPFLMPLDLKNWVRSVREVEDGEDSWLVMLVEVAISCSQTSPEQRPSMWQVLKMIQEIKETMMMEVNKLYTSSGFS